MQKRYRRPLGTSILAVAVTVSALVVWAVRIEMPRLRLMQAQNPAEAARAAKALLKSGSPRDLAAVREYAGNSPTAAFDEIHRILLICDPLTGSVHVADEGRREVSYAQSDDPALHKDAEDAMLITDLSQSFQVGSPPRKFTAVRVMDSEADRVEFLLRDTESTPHVFTVEFKDGYLTRSTHYDVSQEQIDKWKAKGVWPKDWQ